MNLLCRRAAADMEPIMTTANMITLFRILLIPVFIILMFSGFPGADVLALAVFCIASLTDKLDGYIARKYNQVTNFGKFTDPLADKLLVISAFLIFVGQGTMAAVAAIIIVSRELIVTSLRTLAIDAGVVIAAGFWGKFKTVSQLIGIILMLLLPIVKNNILPELNTSLIGTVAMWIITAITLYSGIDYCYTYRHIIIGSNKKA